MVTNTDDTRQESAQIVDEEAEGEIESENSDPIQATYILIESNDVLNINVTPSAYKVMMYLAYNVFGSRANKEDFVESSEKPSLKFLNFMGESCELIMPAQCALAEQHAVGFKLIKGDLTRVPSLVTSRDSLVLRPANLTDTHNYKFQLHLDGFEKCKLSMKYDGS